MILSATGISKAYGHLKVLSGITLSVPEGHFVSIVGPSGCGKTTLLNLLARLDHPDDGSIVIAGGATVGYMMQDPLLLPWRTLAQNAWLGVELLEGKGAMRDNRLENAFRAFDLSGAMIVFPDAASGGMKQRVSLIRTLLTTPALLLLDEPFSSLDFDIKLRIQKHLIDYQKDHATTIVLVTHDIEDAIALSDEVYILSDKPARVKTVVTPDVSTFKRDPIEARKSPRFAEYFSRIWDEIKYVEKD